MPVPSADFRMSWHAAAAAQVARVVRNEGREADF
jgi:hypothetical protein